jgi:MFS family permease
VLAGHGRAVIVTMLLTWMLTAGIVVVILMTPTLLAQMYSLAPATTLSANTIATLALCLGCVVFGRLADRFGAARTLFIGCLALLLATYALYIGTARMPEALPVLYAIAGFCVGCVGVIPTLLVAAFPPAVRFSGISFAYNVAYAIFGGLTPLVVAALMKSVALAPAHYVAVLCSVGAAVALSIDRQRAVPAPSSA